MLETGKQSLNLNQACVGDEAGIFGRENQRQKKAELLEKIRNGESRFEEKHGRRQ